MRTLTFIIALLFDLAVYAQGTVFMVPAIPSGGQVYPMDSTASPSAVYVGTGNAAVNLGSNSYSLQFNGTPPSGTQFICRFDATQLTAVAANVSIFGLTPLVDYPNQGVYYIRYLVSGTRPNNKTVYVSYTSSMVQLQNVNGTVTFNGGVYSNDSLVAKRFRLSPQTSLTPGNAIINGDSSGNTKWGCPACSWGVLGNTGLNGSINFWGTTDTSSLSIRLNNLPAGILSYNNLNSAIGIASLYQNTSGTNNTAFGADALKSVTSGSNNTGLGYNTLALTSTGGNNTGVGATSLSGLTTGSYNIGIGATSTQASNTQYSVAIGQGTTAASYSMALGPNAIAQSQNQLALSPNYQNILWQGHPSAINYFLGDSTGSGNLVLMALPGSGETYFTPVTGDSILPLTQDIGVNPAGTLANLTIIMPALSSGITKIAISTSQVITSLHYSVILEAGSTVSPNAPASILTVTGGQGVVHLKYQPNTSSWQPY